MDQSFFDESHEQSDVKRMIVTEYFKIWSAIMLNNVKAWGKQYDTDTLAYIDLFSGPGKYKDGTSSTPLLILEKALGSPELTKCLITLFNDKDKSNIEALKLAINNVSNIANLKYAPRFYNLEVNDDFIPILNEISKKTPTLLFVDPWGYKGLSLRLIEAVVKHWGSDCILFFNYNRINAAINNPSVEQHVSQLFGSERLEELKIRIRNLSSDDREYEILETLANAFKNMGAKYVLPFRFVSGSQSRTSHHLIFITKNFLGYDKMKEIMADQSSQIEEGVSFLEFNPLYRGQMTFFRPLSTLKEELVEYFTGKTLTIDKIYKAHSENTPYIRKNYRDALLQLEAEGKIKTSPPSHERRKNTFSDKVQVTFPNLKS